MPEKEPFEMPAERKKRVRSRTEKNRTDIASSISVGFGRQTDGQKNTSTEERIDNHTDRHTNRK